MTSDLFERLTDADPARALRRYDDAELARMAATILNTRGAGIGDPGAAQAGRGRTPIRRLLIALPVAAAIAAAVVIAPSLGGAPAVSVEAASLLNQAARSIKATVPVAKPDQWWKTTSTGVGASIINTSSTDPDIRIAILTTGTRTTYEAVDGSRPSVFVDGPSTFVRQLSGDPIDPLDPTFIATYLGQETSVWSTNLSPNDRPGSWQNPNPTFLAALPRDTDALQQRLYDDTAGHGRSTDGEVFVYIADTLRSGLIPADLRAALYRVLATVPGVEITARSATIGSDAGVAFGWFESVDGTRQEIVIDPANGDLVGEREVATTELDGIPAGTVIGETSWMRVLVDAVPTDVMAEAKIENCHPDENGAVICKG